MEGPDPRFGDEPMMGLKLSLAPETHLGDKEAYPFRVELGDIVWLLATDNKCCASAPVVDAHRGGKPLWGWILALLILCVAVLIAAAANAQGVM